MTKKEYLVELTRALRFLDDESRDAVMNFYQEMLDDRIEDGLTEEAAVAQMESPEEIAAHIRAEMNAPLPAESTGNAEHLPEDWEERTLTCAPAQVHAAKLQAQNMAIEILPAQDGQVTLTYFTRRQDVYTAALQGDVLTLTCRCTPSPTRRFMSVLFFHLSSLPVRVTLRVPAEMPLDVSAASRNSGISVQGLQALGILNLETTNGSLTLEHTQCGEATLRTTNARITVQDVRCPALFRTQSSNGGLTLENCHFANGAECVTSNSAIHAENIRCGGALQLRTSNGSIQAHAIEAQSLALQSSNASLQVGGIQASAVSLRTSNASIRGTLPGEQRDWGINSGTTNGKNSLPASQAGEKPLTVYTKNASIQIDFEKR